MKEKLQVFGRFLSGMVMPNIGAFIAWGLITAMFIPTGWLPNEKFATLVGPMASVMLPLLIAYTGGEVVAGKRGGVIGAAATMGVIVGAEVPMFLGAMIVGPLSAWVIKKFDQAVDGHIKPGFEMLVNNFSLGILAAVLALVAMEAISPIVTALTSAMAAGVGVLIDNGLLPMTAIFVEPAKVLFLNNAINHGIFSPMGIQQVEEAGKSIFFLLEANPGPGLGILLAYCLVGKGSAKSSAPGAVIIHFLGGIHEIYFPYILMNPFLLIATIAANATGVFIFRLFDVGLTAPASPGSIIALTMMAERHCYVGLFLGVILSAAVAMAIAIPLLKFMGKDTTLEEAQAKKDAMKAQAKGTAPAAKAAAVSTGVASVNAGGRVKKIAFACDAGMGSSAMGATVLKKKIKAAGLDGIEVIHTSVSSIPADVQIVVTHQSLRERAAQSNPNAELVLITNFLAAPEYGRLVEDLKQRNS
ncbi:MAG: PTS mannitol transporter subunit IICBA [Anaerovibrio sp.]|uniref:PTS mannitol transporter subunit IICB n=1 Tax=Anaerovibrio sp. TaxID=1872532 RepID=UPI00261C6556|nr:PTS mannitol transporter subunit IICBA [Anaerovibrio sp.]MDD7677368.1 PTS mannitol transporter subunit IICBA [Anaerovibrio sp.]MDY2603416.1 PTS mannitol transporter subunit IICBA [Anaerovibrio sp.]